MNVPQIVEFSVPSHWVPALINDDESGFDYDDDPADYEAYKCFLVNEVLPGQDVAWVPGDNTEPYFNPYHDAMHYGIPPCDCTDLKLLVFA